MSMTEREYGPKNNRKPFGFAVNMLLALVCLLISAGPAVSENTGDWITGLPREPIHVAAWPGGRKIAVCFIFYVEIWGFGHGPNFRSDMVARDPDVVDEAFRQYAVDFVRWSQKPLSSRTASTTRPTCSRLGAASTNREHTFIALST